MPAKMRELRVALGLGAVWLHGAFTLFRPLRLVGQRRWRPTATSLWGLQRRDVRVGAPRLEEAHRLHVERVCGPPEGRRPLKVDAAPAQDGERVLHEPQVGLEARIRIGSDLQERLDHVQMSGVLLPVFGGMRV